MTTIKRIGKYEIIGSLGKGAMGVVYKARDVVLGRLVALKTMLEGVDRDEELIKRFHIEAQAAAQLNHENIITIYDLGEADSTYYIAMEFLEGEDLKSIVQSDRDFSLNEKINIVLQICSGLEYAHKRGVVHRDIKPANVMVLKTGKIKLMDFGIAHMASSDMTRTGMIIGTPDYMSPEQVRGHKVDNRTDIFSVGVILFELLTGKKPFSSDSVTTILYKIVHEPIPSFDDIKIDVPVEIESIIMKAVEKDIEKRYQSMTEMMKDLKSVAEMIGAEKAVSEPHLQEQIKKLVEEGKRLVKDKDFQNAAEIFNKALSMDPDNSVIVRLLEKVEGELIKSKQGDIDNILKEAKALADQKKFTDAIKTAGKAFEIVPDNTSARAFITKIEREKTDHEKKALIESQAAKIRSLIEKQKLEEAVKAIDEIRKIDTGGYIVAELSSHLEKQRALLDDQAQVSLILKNAEARMKAGDLAEAEKLVNAALKIDSSDKNAKKLSEAINKLKIKETTKVSSESETVGRTVLARPDSSPTVVDSSYGVDAEPTVLADRSSDTSVEAPAVAKTVMATDVAATKIEAAVRGKPVKSKAPIIITSIAAAVMVAAFLLFVVFKSDKEIIPEPRPLNAGEGIVVFNVVPWAEVTSIQNIKDNSIVPVSSNLTPLELTLPAGKYKVALSNSELNIQKTIEINIQDGQVVYINENIGKLTPDDLIRELGLE